jgi:hypothetical protein
MVCECSGTDARCMSNQTPYQSIPFGAAAFAGCPACGRALFHSVFDTTFALADGDEKQFLGVPGSMCQPCQQLYFDPQIAAGLDVAAGRCLFAIESDQFVVQDFWSAVQAVGV